MQVTPPRICSRERVRASEERPVSFLMTRIGKQHLTLSWQTALKNILITYLAASLSHFDVFTTFIIIQLRFTIKTVPSTRPVLVQQIDICIDICWWISSSNISDKSAVTVIRERRVIGNSRPQFYQLFPNVPNLYQASGLARPCN